MDWSFIISFASTLVILLDPPGNAPVVHSLIQKQPVERRRWIIIREMLFVLALLLLFFIAGRWIMDWLHLSRFTLRFAGGILLFLTALGMIFPTISVLGGGEAKEDGEAVQREIFIVPVAVPLVVGPAAISVVMDASIGADGMHMLSCLIAISVAWLITVMGFLCSEKLLRMLGDKGALVIMRLMGMLLVLLAVEMFMKGITDYIMTLS